MIGAYAAGALCAAVMIVNLVSILTVLIRFRRAKRRRGAVDANEPVTIVRPVCGVEPFIEETLASGFTLDHPCYELIFCVASADDPVVPIVRRLTAAHPEVPSQLLIGDERISENPKLNNCVRGWDAARHDWVILADSNVLMPARLHPADAGELALRHRPRVLDSGRLPPAWLLG